MALFNPWSARDLHEYLSRIITAWDATKEEDREDMINPDEPIVMAIPNPEWQGEIDAYGLPTYEPDEYGNDYFLYAHVESYGGGGDTDEDDNECGHEGLHLTGMEIAQAGFLYNGRRLGKDT